MKKLILLFLISNALVACKKDTNQYIGNWKGIYTGSMGSDTGIFKFTVDGNLKATGETMSRLTNGNASYSGKVYNDGKIILNNGVFYAGASFEGHLSGSTATGTWVAVSICSGCSQSGNWTCTKQ